MVLVVLAFGKEALEVNYTKHNSSSRRVAAFTRYPNKFNHKHLKSYQTVLCGKTEAQSRESTATRGMDARLARN